MAVISDPGRDPSCLKVRAMYVRYRRKERKIVGGDKRMLYFRRMGGHQLKLKAEPGDGNGRDSGCAPRVKLAARASARSVAAHAVSRD